MATGTKKFRVIRKKKKNTESQKTVDTPKKKNHLKWRPELLVDIYELARSGITAEKKMAELLGVAENTLRAWKKNKPEVRYAYQKAVSTSQNTFQDFVFQRLPPHLQEVWEEIDRCDTEGTGTERMRAMLSRQGRAGLQHLFLYALTNGHFSVSAACKKVGVSRRRFETWIRDDLDFADLVDEIHQAKKDFLETKLLERVKDGDVACTIFANKTMNRDRGYAEKIEHQVSGQINVNQTVVSIDSLELPIEVRKIILEALRTQRNNLEKGDENSPTTPPRLIEGEVLSREVVKDDA